MKRRERYTCRRRPIIPDMPLTQLDSTAAFVAVDLQKGITSLPLAHPAAEIIGRTADLARAFRERGWPVVLVNVAGIAPGRTDAGRPRFHFPLIGQTWFRSWSSIQSTFL